MERAKIREMAKSLGYRWLQNVENKKVSENLFAGNEQEYDKIYRVLGKYNIGERFIFLGAGFSRAVYVDFEEDVVIKIDYRGADEAETLEYRGNRGELYNHRLLRDWADMFAPIVSAGEDYIKMPLGKPFVTARDGVIIKTLSCMNYLRNDNYAWFTISDNVEQLKCIDYEDIHLPKTLKKVVVLTQPLSLLKGPVATKLWSIGDCRKKDTGESCTPDGEPLEQNMTNKDMKKLLKVSQKDVEDNAKSQFASPLPKRYHDLMTKMVEKIKSGDATYLENYPTFDKCLSDAKALTKEFDEE